MTKTLRKWTEAECAYINENYIKFTAREMGIHLERHPEVIRTKMRSLKLVSPFLHNKNNTSKWLLDDSLETFYWTGFLMADGNFKRYGDSIIKLRCTLAAKDRPHLERLADKFKTRIHDKISNGRPQVELSVIDTKVIPAYVSKFNITTNKTYSPPSTEILRKFTDSQLLAMLVGFIDGDGCITTPRYKGKGNTIVLVSHISWLHNISLWNDVLYNNSGYDKTTLPYLSNGYVRATWSNRMVLSYLKLFAIANNLPILNRKWDRINLCNVHSHGEFPQHNDTHDYD